jgi:predicted nicotinamide N-methyase
VALLARDRNGDDGVIADVSAFIRANTRVAAAPLVPEIRLHLADDAVALWELTEAEMDAMRLPPPYWAFAWAGGQALARHILDHSQLVRGRSVLDVGSGGGLLAIAAMQAGAARAAAVDTDAFAAHAAGMNADLNGVSVEVRIEDPIGAPARAEIILVGDLFYERDLAARLFEWLLGQKADGRTILIGDAGRAYLPRERLARLADYDVPTLRALEDAEVKRAAVWALT